MLSKCNLCRYEAAMIASVFAVGAVQLLNPVDPWLEMRLVSTLGTYEVKHWFPSLLAFKFNLCCYVAVPRLREGHGGGGYVTVNDGARGRLVQVESS